jgi:hypothetical protein
VERKLQGSGVSIILISFKDFAVISIQYDATGFGKSTADDIINEKRRGPRMLP